MKRRWRKNWYENTCKIVENKTDVTKTYVPDFKFWLQYCTVSFPRESQRYKIKMSVRRRNVPLWWTMWCVWNSSPLLDFAEPPCSPPYLALVHNSLHWHVIASLGCTYLYKKQRVKATWCPSSRTAAGYAVAAVASFIASMISSVASSVASSGLYNIPWSNNDLSKQCWTWLRLQMSHISLGGGLAVSLSKLLPKSADELL